MTQVKPHTEPRTEAAASGALGEIERQVLWLSTAIVHHANRVRPNPGGLKVGGHQASSASMVSIMTSLWFGHLRAEDRVSVKPHASPVLHAINYLLGELDESYLPTLRAFGGLQSYPSRVKDPDPVDYSTGSVGIGATAPIWGAVARRYLTRPLRRRRRRAGRQYSLLGDAELDEGAVWEAIVDPGVAELGEIVWVGGREPAVAGPRGAGDRRRPAAGHVHRGRLAGHHAEVRPAARGAFARPGGEALRHRIDAMPNPEYQRLLRCDAGRTAPQAAGRRRRRSRASSPGWTTRRWPPAIRNLGGHDLAALDAAYDAIDDDRPTVILAYTIKGYGLPIEGHPQNHSALLTYEQINAARRRSWAPTRTSRGGARRADSAAAGCARRRPGGSGGPRAAAAPRPRCPPTSAARRPGWRPPRPRWAGRCST